MNLKDLVHLANSIEELLIESGGEITPDIEAQLSLKEAELPDKIEKYAFTVQRLKSAEQYWRKKSAELLKIAESCEKVYDRLEERIDNAMTEMGVEELQGYEHTFKRVKNPPSLVIEDEALIPESLLSVIPERYEVMKGEVKKALMNGELIPGARLETKTRIKIAPKK